MKRYHLKDQVLFLSFSILTINLWSQTFNDSGISLPQAYNSSVVWGDFDNDSDQDILIGIYGASKNYKNTDGNPFIEQTNDSLTNFWISSSAWRVYENDGDLNILLAGENSPNKVCKVNKNISSQNNPLPANPDGLTS